jgi:hypothetical protein
MTDDVGFGAPTLEFEFKYDGLSMGTLAFNT